MVYGEKLRKHLLDWEEVTDVLGDTSGVDHFKEGPDIDFHFRTLVTKGKSEIRQNVEGIRVR